jgi:cobalt-zinc-cadmium efflux system outer membrane protein
VVDAGRGAQRAGAGGPPRGDCARLGSPTCGAATRAGDLSRIDGNLAQSKCSPPSAELIETEASRLQAEQVIANADRRRAAEVGEEAPAPTAMARLTLANATATHPLLVAAAAAARSARARVTVAAESRRAAPELALRVVRERGDFADPYASTHRHTAQDSVLLGRAGSPRDSGSTGGGQPGRRRNAACAEPVQLEAERAERTPCVHRSNSSLMAQERRQLAADNLRLAEKAFSLGESDLATLLRIRAAAFDAEAFLDRQRVARAAAISRLNQALGVLP